MNSGISSRPASAVMYDESTRRVIRAVLAQGDLSASQQEMLCECYLQKNRIDSTAIKISRSIHETRLWYAAMSMGLAFAAMETRR